AVRIGYRRSVGPACLDRTGNAPQLEIAEHTDGRVVAEVDAARAKADLGVLTCIEEVLPRHDVLPQLRWICDRDRIDPCSALKTQALFVRGAACLDVGERRAEARDLRVLEAARAVRV